MARSLAAALLRGGVISPAVRRLERGGTTRRSVAHGVAVIVDSAQFSDGRRWVLGLLGVASMLRPLPVGRSRAFEQRPEIVEPLIRPPEIVAGPVLAQRMQVAVLWVVEEALEGIARWPLDEDERLARLGVADAHRGIGVELAEGDDGAAVLAHRGE